MVSLHLEQNVQACCEYFHHFGGWILELHNEGIYFTYVMELHRHLRLQPVTWQMEAATPFVYSVRCGECLSCCLLALFGMLP